eukprot:214918_1
MLSLIVYMLVTFNNKNLQLKHQILMAICMFIELTWIYYHINLNDPVFMGICKFATICAIIIPFLQLPNVGKSIEFEGCFDNKYKHSSEYKYFMKKNAHNRFKKYKLSECGICLDKFDLNNIIKNIRNNFNPSQLQLLQCGHLYHKPCIQENEYYCWNNQGSNLYHPYGKCPLCRIPYHSNTEKFQFNPNYFDDPYTMKNRWKRYNTFADLSGGQ